MVIISFRSTLMTYSLLVTNLTIYASTFIRCHNAIIIKKSRLLGIYFLFILINSNKLEASTCIRKYKRITASILTNILIGIAATLCWASPASAFIINYELAGDIRYADGQCSNGGPNCFDDHFMGTLLLDTTDLSDESYLGHTYSLFYNFKSSDGQYRYRGEGTLDLASYDSFLNLEGFGNYWDEEAITMMLNIPPYEPRGMAHTMWREPDWNIASMISENYRSYGPINFEPAYGRQISRSEISLTRHVPEPGTLVLLSLGLVGIGFTRRRMKNKQI